MSERLRIVIPTYRRAFAQHTFQGLPNTWHDRVTLVVDEQDAKIFRRDSWRETGCEVVVVPETVHTIAQKRAWILRELPYELLVMMDDDLRFACRLPSTPVRLVPADPTMVAAHLGWLEMKLQSDVAHAGWSARQGNNRLDDGWISNTRMMYVLGYRRSVVLRECQLGRVETREDMDYTLQLLRRGFPNAVSSLICADQKYNAPGGASLERTTERSNADAEKLAELHPGLVKVVQKSYKGSIPRKEVICYWKKAFRSDVTPLEEQLG